MATSGSQQKEQEERIPIWQVLLDDVFLLLALGLGLPLILYIIWGIFDLANVPTFKP